MALPGSVDGVKAFGAYINKHGGLAGRKVVVDFIDSKLSADAARDAVIKACEHLKKTLKLTKGSWILGNDIIAVTSAPCHPRWLRLSAVSG